MADTDDLTTIAAHADTGDDAALHAHPLRPPRRHDDLALDVLGIGTTLKRWWTRCSWRRVCYEPCVIRRYQTAHAGSPAAVLAARPGAPSAADVANMTAITYSRAAGYFLLTK